MANSERILYETDTALEHYAVIERIYEGRPARVLFSGPKRSAQSGIALDDEPDLLFDYNQRLLELASGLYPGRILIIGGGAFTLPMALLTALPETKIDVVELDSGLAPIAQQFFGLQEQERLRIIFGDGREYLKATAQKYDLIILDVFSELAIPRQFLTLECISLLKQHLLPGGSVAMNIIASYQGRGTELIKSQVTAYSKLFDRLDIFPAAENLTSWFPQNLVLCAQLKPSQDVASYLRYEPIRPIEATLDDVYRDDEVIAA